MPLFKQVNALVLHVQNLSDGIDFYHDKLGHKLVWRNDDRAGLVLGESKLVLSTVLDTETNILVESVTDAIAAIVKNGGKVISPLEDIPVGNFAVIEDPFGNQLTLVDFTKGTYKTDDSGNIVGIESLKS